MSRFALFFDDSTGRFKRISGITHEGSITSGQVNFNQISVNAASGIIFREDPLNGLNKAILKCSGNQSTDRSYTIPSVIDSFFVMTEGDSSISGTKTFFGTVGIGQTTPLYKLDVWTDNTSQIFRIRTESNTIYPSITFRRNRASLADPSDGDILSEISSKSSISSSDVTLGINQFIYKTGNKAQYLIQNNLGSGLTNSFKIDENLKYYFYNSSGTSVSLKVHSSASSVDYVLPQTDGSSGQFLKTDGSGNLSFGEPSVSIRNYDFDVGAGGQTVFTAGESLTGKTVKVYQNGILKRVGSGYDFTISGTNVTFTYTIPQNAWVRIEVMG